MKKSFCLVLALALLLLSACGGDDIGIIGGADGPTSIFISSGWEKPQQWTVRIVRIGGEYYYDTETESTMGPRCGMMDGSVASDSSPISPYELPQGDNESNFGVTDTTYFYQLGLEENTIELLDGGIWWVYKKIIADKDLSAYRYAYTLKGTLPQEKFEGKWLVFSDSLDLTFSQAREALAGAETGETKSFYYMRLR